MALSADAAYETKPVLEANPIAMIVLNAAVIYNGALCSHDTTGGEIKPFDGTQTDRIVGWHFGPTVTGDSSASDRPRARIVKGGFIVRNLPMGGISNNATDYGDPVYATDDGTYTATDPTSGQKLGVILPDDDRDSGKANVYFFPITQGV